MNSLGRKKSSYGQRAFSFSGVCLWCSLPSLYVHACIKMYWRILKTCPQYFQWACSLVESSARQISCMIIFLSYYWILITWYLLLGQLLIKYLKLNFTYFLAFVIFSSSHPLLYLSYVSFASSYCVPRSFLGKGFPDWNSFHHRKVTREGQVWWG